MNTETEDKISEPLRALIDYYWKNARKPGAPDTDIEPYPGLRSFSLDEEQLFFGRSLQIRQLCERFRQNENHVVLVLGGSGSGKSSLIRAGLLPRLRMPLSSADGRPITSRAGRWLVATCRPRTDPTTELADALWQAVCAPFLMNDRGRRALDDGFKAVSCADSGRHSELTDEAFRARFNSLVTTSDSITGETLIDAYGVQSLVNIVLNHADLHFLKNVRSADPSLFLLLDQFEEIFDDRQISKNTRAAVAELIDVTRMARGGLFIAITMRSESLHRCAEDQRLVDLVNQASFLLELIADTDVPEAIVKPARTILSVWDVGFDQARKDSPFEPSVVDALEKNMRHLRESLIHKPDSLPLLQHALEAIWTTALKRWTTDVYSGRPLKPEITMADYLATFDENAESPFRQCLDRQANQCLREAKQKLKEKRSALSDEEAGQLIATCFATLARRDDRGAWVREFRTSRQFVEDSGIAEEQQFKAQDIDDALQPFVDAGYLQWDRKDGARQYNVSHEALIRSWSAAQTWLNDAEELTRILRKLYEEVEVSTTRFAVGRWNLGLVNPIDNLLAARDLNAEKRKSLRKLFGPKAQYASNWGVQMLNLARYEIGKRSENAPAANADDETLKRRLRELRAFYLRAANWPTVKRRMVILIVIGLGVLFYPLNETLVQVRASDSMLARAECLVKASYQTARDLTVSNECKIAPGKTEAEQKVFGFSDAMTGKFYMDAFKRFFVSKKFTFDENSVSNTCMIARQKLTDKIEVSIQDRFGRKEIRRIYYDTQEHAYKYYREGGSDEQKFSSSFSYPWNAYTPVIKERNIVCISDNADMLMIWNLSKLPLIYPLAWGVGWVWNYQPLELGVDNPDITLALSSVVDWLDSQKPANSARSDPDFALRGYSTTKDMIRSFDLQFDKEGEQKSFRFVAAVGVNGPERVSVIDEAKLSEVKPDSLSIFDRKENQCLDTTVTGFGDIEKYGKTCKIKAVLQKNDDFTSMVREAFATKENEKGQAHGGVFIDAKPYVLFRTLGTQESKWLMSPTCEEKTQPCRQNVALLSKVFDPDRTTEMPLKPFLAAPRFQKGDHYSARVDAAVVRDGYLYLHDASGAVWRYVVEFKKFEELSRAVRDQLGDSSNTGTLRQ